jgi:cell division protein FtsI/penicillin-binding protein 2
LEASYDEELKGTPGKKINYNAFIGDQMPGSWNALKEKKDGETIVLTINHYLQTKVEAILEKHCKIWNATGGVAIVMNPKTGEILTLANYPTFNLEDWENFWDKKKYMNRAISMNFEPGSIFKPITASAALEEGIITPETLHNCGRSISIGGITIECEANHGTNLDLSGILRNSCNVAFAKIGQKLGKTFYEYMKRFNFGSKFRCGLTGQESGILPEPEIWTESTASTMAFGQGLSVTPLQMISAYSAIINGGVMMKPIIVKQILTSQNIVRENNTPEEIKRVISKSTSEKIVKALQNVVQDPRSMANANIDGMSIGGKTGTAKQVTNGLYDNNKLVCSFIGFFPVEDPEYVILVSIQEPDHWNGYQEAFGSSVSAPAFREIAYWINTNPFKNTPK